MSLATEQRMSPRVANLPNRVSLSVACAKLGISKGSYYLHWKGVFTPYETDGGKHLVSEDELLAAVKHVKPTDQRAAVLQLRAELKRL